MTTKAQEIIPPDAKQVPKELTIHGDTRIDNYYWLNERENPEVISYLEAENTYTDSQMRSTKGLQETLYEEMVGRLKQTDMSVPYLKDGYYFYNRYEEGKEYPIYVRKKGSLDAEEDILLNVNEMAEGHDYYSVRGLQVSDNENLLAYFVDTVGRRRYTLKFKNLTTGEILTDEIPDASGFAWSADNKTVFYGIKDPQTLRVFQTYRYELGTGIENAELVWEEEDDTFDVYVYRSKSKRFVMIASYATLSQEYQYLEADTPAGEFQMIQPRERKLEYSVSHYGDNFYILTNLDAKNFRLMKASIGATTKENWKEVIPHREDVYLENFDIFKDYLVLEERENGLTQVRIKPWDGSEEHFLPFEEAAYYAYTTTNLEFDTPILRFGYTSLTTPNSIFDYDMSTREKTLLKQQEVIGEFNAEDYQSERVFATAQDGTKVPISIVYKKGIEKNGENPLLLYAYGSYGSSSDPYFSSARLSLLDRGFVFAIAHIRGGQEMGRSWYEDGKMFKKMNTFTDFNDCATFLIQENFTSSEKLFAYGGSAGGLLMGAIINLQPELYKGVIAAVPFVDVVTTMLDESIPLTTGEFDEWGNPKNEDSYHYMLSYSPYDQVKAQEYPNLLVTAGLHDSQVQYWEPAKWVAKLRDLKTDNNLLLLKTDMDSGHSGKTGRFKRYEEIAFEYAFLLNLVGVEQ